MFMRTHSVRCIHTFRALYNVSSINQSSKSINQSVQSTNPVNPDLLLHEIKHLIYTKKFSRLFNRLKTTNDIQIINQSLYQLIDKQHSDQAFELLHQIDKRKLTVDHRIVNLEIELIRKLLRNDSNSHNVDQSIDQSVNQSIDQSVNQSIDQSVNQSVNQPINQSISQSSQQDSKHFDRLSQATVRAWKHSQSLIDYPLRISWCGVFAESFERMSDHNRMGELLIFLSKHRQSIVRSSFVDEMYHRMLHMFTQANRQAEIDLLQSTFPFRITNPSSKPHPVSMKTPVKEPSEPSTDTLHVQSIKHLVAQGSLDEAIAYLTRAPHEMTSRCWRAVMLPLVRVHRYQEIVQLWNLWLTVLSQTDLTRIPPHRKLAITPPPSVYKLLLKLPKPPLNAATALAQIDHWDQKWDPELHNYLTTECMKRDDVDGAQRWIEDMERRGIIGDEETLGNEIGILKALTSDPSLDDISYPFAQRIWTRCEALQHEVPWPWLVLLRMIFKRTGQSINQKQVETLMKERKRAQSINQSTNSSINDTNLTKQ